MAKSLKAEYPDRCIGCEMCVLESQHQLKKLGLEGALIRIFRNMYKDRNIFSVDIDPRINKTNIEKIKDSCPQGVFLIEDES